MSRHIALAKCSITRPAHLGGRVELAVAEPAQRVFPARLSTGLGVCVKWGGHHRVTINGRRALYPADSVAVRAPGCVWASLDGVQGFISIDIAAELLPESGISGTMGFLGRHAVPDLATVTQRLVSAESALEAEEIVAGLVDSVVGSGAVRSDGLGDPGGARGAVDDARDFLAENLCGRPTLEQAAKIAGVSKFTLLRRFKRALGTTPHAYLVMLRIARAQQLLAAGSSPVEAAHETGFSDQSHLGRWFRRALGVTPAAYANEARRVRSIPLRVNSVPDAGGAPWQGAAPCRPSSQPIPHDAGP
jgi:AraC-like DNA-binding protein